MYQHGTDKIATTLVALLRQRARYQPDRHAYIYLVDGEQQEESISYRQLDRQACAIAARLQQSTVSGGRALLLYSPGLNFITAFFGCLYADIVAVPLYLPSLKRFSQRFQAVLDDARPSLILTESSLIQKVKNALLHANITLPSLATDTIAPEERGQWSEPTIAGHTLAFLQYTSGSTASPKGVMVTHDNLLHNLSMMQQCFGLTPASKGVSWLPPYHDMGLIGGILEPLYSMFPMVLMAPAAFLQRPVRWLEAISRHRATISGGPNFAYNLCTRKITRDEEATLDLRSWETAFNGSEPVGADTLAAFALRFASTGFRSAAFFPCYGLAEATLIVSGGEKAAPPLTLALQREALTRGEIIASEREEADAYILVSCGYPLAPLQVMIVDPTEFCLCTPEQVGEVWIAGPSVAQGYWEQPAETALTFKACVTGERGRFLRTGDLGFLWRNELFITGRRKDLVIIRGRNFYPQDIELTVERSAPGLRAAGGAAFSILEENEEKLVVVQELERHYQSSAFPEIYRCARQAVVEEYGIQLHTMVLIKMNSMPKTSSGKVQRNECKERFLAHTLEVIDSNRWRYVHREPSEDKQFISRDALSESRLSLQAHIQWQAAQILHLPPDHLQPHYSLLDGGIDSLSAMELQGALANTLAITVPLEMLLGPYSVEQLVTFLQDQMQNKATTPPSVKPSRHMEAEYPLSYGQRALWFMQQMAATSSAYFIVRALRITSPIDISVLQQAFDTLCERHSALRTTFVSRQGIPMQIVQKQVKLLIKQENVEGLSAASLAHHIDEVAYRPFDWAQEPPVRAHIFTKSPREHILLFAIHHIIADLWSLSLLLHEFVSVYQAHRANTSLQLPRPEFQYVDFVHWQAELLRDQAGQKHWSYWQQTLAAPLPILALPTDKPRPDRQTYVGAAYNFSLSDQLTQQLRELARAEGVTLYTTLLAAFQVLLSRYTRQTDLLIGSTATGRSQREFADLLGYFANLLVLRADLSPRQRFTDLLKALQHTVTQALEHQDYPFSLLIEKLPPVRDPRFPPLIQVAFIAEKAPLSKVEPIAALIAGQPGIVEIGDMCLEPFTLQSRGAQFDLALIVSEGSTSLLASFEYNTDLFQPVTVQHIADMLQTLLLHIVERPDQCIALFPLLTRAKQKELVEKWYPRNPVQGLYYAHDLFERQAEKHPDSIALVYEDQQISYRELSRRSNQLAHYLRSLGISPEKKVAICIGRSLDRIIAVLGVLKSGGVYVPLDPIYPHSWLETVIAESDLSLIIVQKKWSFANSQRKVAALDLADLWSRIDQKWDDCLRSGVMPENLAYIIYTSGSTGRPKGVMVAHRGLCTLAAEQIRAFEVHRSSRVLQFASFNFDASISELLMALLSGATLCLNPTDSFFVGEELSSYINEQAISIVTLPPSVIASLPSEPLPTLRSLISAGEPCFIDIVRRWQQGRSFFNAYGPTESTVCATIMKCVDATERPAIGEPIAGTWIYLLDPYMQPVPIGMPGEIYIGGIGIARGYLHNAALTASYFVPDPFSRVGGGRLYRTSDLARYCADGTFEFLGRLDRQVKIRGVRVELEEIEAVLREHPAVRDALSVVHAQASNVALYAYVTIDKQQADVERTLRQFLKARLPGQAQPQAIINLPFFPLTHAGKVNMRALPLPETLRPHLETPHIPPQTDIERQLANIWAEVIGIQEIGLQDNFFELGGHSLLATQLISRIQNTFGILLPVRSIFEMPTIAELALSMETFAQSKPLPALTPLAPARKGKELLLSFAQQRLWFLDQLEPGCPYHIPAAIQIQGPLNLEVLHSSFLMLMQRHESLRTIFVQRAGEPRQIVVLHLPFPLTLCDLGELPPAQQQERVEQLARQEAIQPFALARGPLLRLTLLRLGARHHVLLLTIHHIIWDGWSTAICLQEIAHIYQTLEEGKTPEVPALSIQYADYAHWQREQVQGEFLNRQLDYWREKLAGLAPLELPLDRPRPELPSYQGELIAINFPADLTRALKALCKQEGVTLFMLLLAAFQTLLYRYSGQHDIAIGSPIANRNRSEIEHVIGFFVNTLVVRTHFQGNPSFGELLQQVRESALQAYAHQDVPFEKLVEALHPERTLNVTPLFQIMFILQSNRLENLKIPGLSIKGQATHSHTSKFDITVDAVETDEGDLATSIEFSTDIFDKATIVRMMCHFQYLLSQITKNPDVRVDEIQCIPPEEQKELLARGNGARQSRHYRHSVDNFIALQAQKTPDAIAVIYGTEQITYRRLEEEIERLASYLQHLGVESETVVGVCLESSLEMIIAILGILKAGGAYLPIDYTFPSERITLMLNDAEPFLIIAQMHLTKCLSAYQRQILCIDSDLTWKTAVEPRQSYTQMNRLAYIIYTSGSTGIPKGVAVEHQSLASYVTAAKKLYNLREGDRVLQFSSINWDTSSEEIYPCLVSGATLVLLTKATSLAFSNLKQLCREAAITVINVPTACWHDMADEVADSDLDSYSTLRLVIFGGEQAKARALKQWTKHHMQHIQLLNEFGMTEATAVTTTYMPESLDAHRRYLPIGHPIEANQVYVLNSALLPVPIGVTGQLYIGGRGLSRGYFKRPDATAERFIPDPFSMQPGARLFATGDYARYRVNGDLEHLGRMDKRVKIRGIRIEINEVEAALLEHPSIERAAVKAREEATGNNELVAYIVCKGQRRTPPEIKLFLQKKLPNYMLPARYIFLDMLPLSLAGKIDYLQLPQPDSLRPELDIAYVPPDNDIEQRISMLWRQVLNLDKVGVHDNFFDIGGHSLALIKVHKLLEQNFAREIPLVELYRYSTIRLQKQYLVGEYEEKSRTRIDQERMKKQRQAISRQHLLSKKRREE